MKLRRPYKTEYFGADDPYCKGKPISQGRSSSFRNARRLIAARIAEDDDEKRILSATVTNLNTKTRIMHFKRTATGMTMKDTPDE